MYKREDTPVYANNVSDEKILALLRAKHTQVDIATQLGINKNTLHARVGRLIEEGKITKEEIADARTIESKKKVGINVVTNEEILELLKQGMTITEVAQYCNMKRSTANARVSRLIKAGEINREDIKSKKNCNIGNNKQNIKKLRELYNNREITPEFMKQLETELSKDKLSESWRLIIASYIQIGNFSKANYWCTYMIKESTDKETVEKLKKMRQELIKVVKIGQIKRNLESNNYPKNIGMLANDNGISEIEAIRGLKKSNNQIIRDLGLDILD